tara:strand:+ start:670 stop:1554 length:885 start_codon:yes stop_codon:yes gene_type:complete
MKSLSIVIIGYNTAECLKKLLLSIQEAVLPHDIAVELIYVDDSSSDNSLNLFDSFKIDLIKKSFRFSQNKGRVHATNKGISLASLDWILFLQSNITVNKNIVLEYQKTVEKTDCIAVGGKILYESEDAVFQKYLNNPMRGSNQYRQYQNLQYEHLLFGNCVIKRSVFESIPLNLKLVKYGGEELDFAYRLHINHYKKMIYCNSAIVTRKDHPGLIKHLSRLEEFGRSNLTLLEDSLQRRVLKKNFFTLIFIYNNGINLFTNRLGIFFYKNIAGYFFIIKIILLTSIIKGMHQKN